MSNLKYKWLISSFFLRYCRAPVGPALQIVFLVSRCGLACPQEISLVLAHLLVDSRWIARLALTQGMCVFNMRVHCVSHAASVRKCSFYAEEDS